MRTNVVCFIEHHHRVAFQLLRDHVRDFRVDQVLFVRMLAPNVSHRELHLIAIHYDVGVHHQVASEKVRAPTLLLTERAHIVQCVHAIQEGVAALILEALEHMNEQWASRY